MQIAYCLNHAPSYSAPNEMLVEINLILQLVLRGLINLVSADYILYVVIMESAAATRQKADVCRSAHISSEECLIHLHAAVEVFCRRRSHIVQRRQLVFEASLFFFLTATDESTNPLHGAVNVVVTVSVLKGACDS